MKKNFFEILKDNKNGIVKGLCVAGAIVGLVLIGKSTMNRDEDEEQYSGEDSDETEITGI